MPEMARFSLIISLGGAGQAVMARASQMRETIDLD